METLLPIGSTFVKEKDFALPQFSYPKFKGGFNSVNSDKREDEVRIQAAEVLRIDPKFSVESFARRQAFKDRKIIDDMVSAYHKAGLR